MPRFIVIAITLVVITVGSAACGSLPGPLSSDNSSAEPSGEVEPLEPGGEGGSAEPSGGVGPPGGGEPVELCAGLVAGEAGRVANDELVETSGIAASQRFEGVLWATNDSGHGAAVFAVGLDGADLGRFELGIDGLIDTEDLAIVGDQLYLADIGDNDHARPDVAVYRFAEPDPSGGAGPEGGVEPVEQIRLQYPDGPRDAEALLVDGATGTLLLIDKDVAFASDPATPSLLAPAPGRIYTASPPFTPGEVHPLTLAGEIDLERLANRSDAPAPEGVIGDLGVAGVVTGADLRADGRAIVLRTYQTAWLFARSEGQTVADALAGEPCEAPTVPEEQGEAVAFLTGSTNGLATIGEGAHPPLNVVRTG